MPPLVSVKMITYNHAPFIKQAIEGVLQQRTDFPFELVIGEDRSTDGTHEIVLGYQKKHPDVVRVITSDKNVGMKKNGLRTFKACQGTYLAFCEGDDYWHDPRKLQKQAVHLQDHRECGLVYSSFDVLHTATGRKIRDFIRHRNWTMPRTPTVAAIVEGAGGMSHGILTCTIMLRRQLAEQIIAADPVLHQSGRFLMGDTQLWAEMAARSELHFMPESTATHIITDESASRSQDRKKAARFAVSGAELLLYLCDKYHLPENIRRKHELNWYSHTLELAFHAGDAELAAEVRRRKRMLTWKEWLRYCGARYLLVHRLYCLSLAVRNAVRRKPNTTWL